LAIAINPLYQVQSAITNKPGNITGFFRIVNHRPNVLKWLSPLGLRTKSGANK
jgi:hypothetical protein